MNVTTTPQMTTLAATAKTDEILEVLDRDGGVILENFLAPERVDRMLEELGPYIGGTEPVADDFAGHQTTRTGGLVVRSQEARKLVTEPALLEAANAFLEPYTEKIRLNLTQIIRLLPGQGAQEFHRDRFGWGKYLPREIEPQFNTIWALTDFTAENGATRVVPGSHRWDWDRVAKDEEVAQAVMSRGSVIFYTGSVIHSGGENRSNGDRIALNLTYNNAWLRQEENQYLTCPPEVARNYDSKLQAILGYTMANYGLGYYSPVEFTPGRPDTLPPEFAVMDSTKLEDADVGQVKAF